MIERAPRWAVILLLLGAGIAFCIDSSSTLFLFIHNRWAELLAELTLLALLTYWLRVWLRGARTPACRVDTHVDTLWLPMTALLIVLALATGAMSKQWDLNPQGQWDAWSIWNLRAKFLAEPALASRAWSPLLDQHPSRISTAAAGRRRAHWISDRLGYAFFLSLIAAVTGGIAIARGPLAGVVAGLTLATSGALLHEVPAQYADVPLAAYLSWRAGFHLDR